MKKSLFSGIMILLCTGYYASVAQETSTIVQMIEWKYKSAREVKATYGATRKYWMEKVPEITTRFGFTSETGRFYGFTNTAGLPDMGKVIGSRERITEAFKKDDPATYKRIMDNMEGPATRSYWKIATAISNISDDYDANSFDYRKMTLFSIPHGSAAQFESLMKEVIAAEKKAGIELTRIYAQSMEGYPSNYYILMYPDLDELSYYQKKTKREAIRNQNNALLELLEKVKAMMTIVRIDHLNRIPF